nr:ES protein [Haemonchus contortus]
MSPSATPMDTDGEGNLHISENGNAEGDSHETSAQMETDTAPTTKDNDKKVNEMNDSKELIIDDQNTGSC